MVIRFSFISFLAGTENLVTEAQLQDRVAAAFRLVGEDRDFSEHCGEYALSIAFGIEEPRIRGLVHIENGRVHWSTGDADDADLRVTWRRWKDLKRWTESITPLWWHRILGRLSMSGKVTPVTQECLYLFRNYFKMMMSRQ